MRLLIAVLFVALFAAPAYSQVVPSHYTFSLHVASTPNAAPITTHTAVKATDVTCDLAPGAVPPIPNINPRYIIWTDPERPTRECRFDTAASTPIFAWPSTGTFVLKAVASLVVGGVPFLSPTSDPTLPFVRGSAPAQVTGLKIGGE